MPRVFGITGWKNSGKTTLVARLVEEFSSRGLTVSTIKHASHTYTLDHEGTDTHAHKAAGAHEIAIAADNRWAIMHEGDDTEPKQSLSAMLARLSPCDIVLVEGFKKEPVPKLQAMRRDAKEATPIWHSNETVIAVASDYIIDTEGRPLFDINAIASIADFILERTATA